MVSACASNCENYPWTNYPLDNAWRKGKEKEDNLDGRARIGNPWPPAVDSCSLLGGEYGSSRAYEDCCPQKSSGTCEVTWALEVFPCKKLGPLEKRKTAPQADRTKYTQNTGKVLYFLSLLTYFCPLLRVGVGDRGPGLSLEALPLNLPWATTEQEALLTLYKPSRVRLSNLRVKLLGGSAYLLELAGSKSRKRAIKNQA